MKNTALILIIVLSFILASCKAKHTNTKATSYFNVTPAPDNSSKPTGYNSIKPATNNSTKPTGYNSIKPATNNSTKPANNGKYIKVIINNSSYAALKDDGTVISCDFSNNCNNPKNVKNLKEVSNIYAAGATFAAIYGKNKKLFVWTNPEHGQTITVNAKPLLNVHAVTSSKSQHGSIAAVIYGANNQVFMWGTNTYAVVVHYTSTSDVVDDYTSSPITNVKSLAASNGIFVAIFDSDNKVFTWNRSNDTYKIMLDKSAKIPVTHVKSVIFEKGGDDNPGIAAIYGNYNKVFTWSYSNGNVSGGTVMLDKSAKTPLTNVTSISMGRNYSDRYFVAIYGSDHKVFTLADSIVMLDKSAKTPLTNVTSISSSAAIYGNDYKVFVWSSNYKGNGNYNVNGSTVMLDKSAKTPLTNVKSIFATGETFTAIYGDDNKMLWFNRPYNNEVALGITLTTDNNTPLTNVKSISTTSGAFAAIYDNDNKVFIWGNSAYGGTFNTKSGTIMTSNNTPLTNVTSIFAQDDGFAAIYNNQKNILIWGAGGIHDIKP